MLWGEVKSLIKQMFNSYPMRKVGFITGIIIGVAILAFGFFNTIFAFFCGIIGLYIGSRFEEGDDLVDKTLKAIENSVPERFRYWKYFN
ncbi:MAG: DUF2273 domain-containing protein [Selenomonadaceae bacterium]|nr:DUF2273 domain-containing protein [Selenomonadaceae bacterium]